MQIVSGDEISIALTWEKMQVVIDIGSDADTKNRQHIRLLPAEARQLAAYLVTMADQCESKSPEPVQASVSANMDQARAGELVPQATPDYFNDVANLVLASKAILLKKMTESLDRGALDKADEDALRQQMVDLINEAAAVAANATAETESALSALGKTDQSLEKYQLLLDKIDKKK